MRWPLMKTRGCPTLGKGFCSCFHRRRKAVDIIKINKDSVWKRNLLRKRNDSSSTVVIIIQLVRKPYKGWDSILLLSLQENIHLQKAERTWTSRCLKNKRKLSRKNHQAKRNLTYGIISSAGLKFHYLNIHTVHTYIHTNFLV